MYDRQIGSVICSLLSSSEFVLENCQTALGNTTCILITIQYMIQFDYQLSLHNVIGDCQCGDLIDVRVASYLFIGGNIVQL